MKYRSDWLLAVLSFISIVDGIATQVALPTGYIIVPSSISPNGEYGVSAFDNLTNDLPYETDRNKIYDLKSGKVVAEINSARSATIRMNRGGILPARWSQESSLLLWEVEGRWSPDALVLLNIENKRVVWQLDLLKTAQQAILIQTRKAAPEKYAAAKNWNRGDGEEFPDGFTVNVRTEGDKSRGGELEAVKGKPVSLPLKVHVELTSNPKDIEGIKNAQLDSELDGIVSQQGKFNVTHFSLRKKPYSNALSDSWLELTDPAAARTVSNEYGDDVSFSGNITSRKTTNGKSIYILTLKHKLSIPASDSEPAEDNVSEVQLLEFDKWFPLPKVITKGGVLKNANVSGLIGHTHSKDQTPAVTLKVNGYGYSE